MNEYTQYQIIDRFLSPRGLYTEFKDAVIALEGFLGGRIQAYNHVQGIWITLPIRG